MPLGLAGAQYRNTSLTKQGDLGSQLPPMPSQATWRAGTATLHCTGYDTRLIVLHACAGKSYEVGWTVQANHGGGCDTPTVLCCWGRGRAGRGGGGSPCAARADVLRARLSYAYRMAPLSSALTEQDFRKMPLDMVGNRCGVHPPQLTHRPQCGQLTCLVVWCRQHLALGRQPQHAAGIQQLCAWLADGPGHRPTTVCLAQEPHPTRFLGP
jgi:hypothetical protein